MSEEFEVTVVEQNETLSEKEIFDFLKESNGNIDFNKIRSDRENLKPYVDKILLTQQKDVAKQLVFVNNCLNKEKKLLELSNLTTYIKKDLLLEYINKNTNRSVVMSYIEQYPREIPDDVIEKYRYAKELNIFDKFLIVYTDYTGEARAKVEEELREKDPILLGVFIDGKESLSYDRMYFIADWEDEFCDLTLEKLIQEQRDINVTESIIGEISESDFEVKISELETLTKPVEKHKKLSWFEKLMLKLGFEKSKKSKKRINI